MKLCKTIADGVRAALAIYNSPEPDWMFLPAGEGDCCDHLTVGGETYPLFWWRTDTQVKHLIEFAPDTRPCSMKLNRSCAKSEGLDRLLYRELDIATACLGAPIDRVMCFRREHALNMLATMKNERVAIFELAAVLNDNTPEQGRHTFWGEDGMSSDRVVSQKVASESIYLFTEEEEKPEVFNDIFLYMYGLNKTEATKAAAIVEILMGQVDPTPWIEMDAHYRRCMAAVAASAQMATRTEVQA